LLIVKTLLTVSIGMEYATQCENLTDNISICNKWKAQLIQTYYSFLKVGYSTKKQLKEAIRKANTAEENHEMMKFIEAKVACEVNKHDYLKWFKFMI